MTQSTPPQTKQPRLTEDWIATLLGLAIVFIIGSGLIGPGPQSVSLKAKAGERVEADILARAGWTISVTLGDDKLSPTTTFDDLNAQTVYHYRCVDGQLISVGTAAEPKLASDKARLLLDNQCEATVSLSYKTSSAIPWPLIK